MEPKTGYKTTEFWLTVVTLLFSVLVTAGILTSDEAREWQDLLAPAITAVAPLVAYIWSRAKVKSGQGVPNALEFHLPEIEMVVEDGEQ